MCVKLIAQDLTGPQHLICAGFPCLGNGVSTGDLPPLITPRCPSPGQTQGNCYVSGQPRSTGASGCDLAGCGNFGCATAVISQFELKGPATEDQQAQIENGSTSLTAVSDDDFDAHSAEVSRSTNSGFFFVVFFFFFLFFFFFVFLCVLVCFFFFFLFFFFLFLFFFIFFLFFFFLFLLFFVLFRALIRPNSQTSRRTMLRPRWSVDP